MLELYARLARWLQPRAWLGWVLVAGAVLAFPAAIFVVKGETGQYLGLAAIAMVLWALTLSAFIRAFAGTPPAPDAGLLGRLRALLRRLYRGFLALLITLLLVVVIWFSIRAVLLVTDLPAWDRTGDQGPGEPAAIAGRNQKK